MMGNQLLNFASFQALQGQRCDVRAQRPRQRELRTIGHHAHQRHGRALLDLKTDQLQRRGIGPVDIFPDLQHRPAFGFFEQPGGDLIEGTAALLLWCERRRRIDVRQGKRKQRREQRHCLTISKPVAGERLFEFGQLDGVIIVTRPAQQPLQMFDHRIQWTVGVIG